MQRRPGGRGLWTLCNNNGLCLFTQSLLSSGSIQFEFEILGNIQRELLKQHQATWCYSWLKLIHFRKMVKLDGFIKNENSFLKNHKYENMCLMPCPHQCALKSMRFRYHQKRIDQRFASTQPFWCVLNCPTLKRSKTIELHVTTSVELATNTKGFDIFGHRFHFDAFSTGTGERWGRGGIYTG